MSFTNQDLKVRSWEWCPRQDTNTFKCLRQTQRLTTRPVMYSSPTNRPVMHNLQISAIDSYTSWVDWHTPPHSKQSSTILASSVFEACCSPASRQLQMPWTLDSPPPPPQTQTGTLQCFFRSVTETVQPVYWFGQRGRQRLLTSSRREHSRT